MQQPQPVCHPARLKAHSEQQPPPAHAPNTPRFAADPHHRHLSQDASAQATAIADAVAKGDTQAAATAIANAISSGNADAVTAATAIAGRGGVLALVVGW